MVNILLAGTAYPFPSTKLYEMGAILGHNSSQVIAK